MKELMQKTIELLKTRVNRNLDIIKENQQFLKNILKEPASEERSVRLKKRYDINKNLLIENNDFINIQLSLINFIDKYKDTLVLAKTSVTEREKKNQKNKDYFNLTIRGELPFNTSHPLYQDKDFFKKW